MISEVVNTLFLTYWASEYIVAKDDHAIFSGIQREYWNWKSSRTLYGLGAMVLGINLMDRYDVLGGRGGGTTTTTAATATAGKVVWHESWDFLHRYAMVLRFVVAASSYVVALYVDINRRYVFDGCRLGRRRGNTPSNNTPRNNNSGGDANANDDDDASKQLRPRRRNALLPCRAFLPRVGRAFCRVLPAYPFLAVLISFGFMFIIGLWEFLRLPMEWLQMPIYYGTLYGPFGYVYVHVKHQVLCTEGHALPS